jgi:hypothetical protein
MECYHLTCCAAATVLKASAAELLAAGIIVLNPGDLPATHFVSCAWQHWQN